MLKNLILADLKFEYKEQNLLLEKFSIENKYIDIGFNLNSKEKLKASLVSRTRGKISHLC